MIKFILNLFKHQHNWRGSGFNRYGIEVEETCQCGAIRHRTLEDLLNLDEDTWHTGHHPSRNPNWKSPMVRAFEDCIR